MCFPLQISFVSGVGLNGWFMLNFFEIIDKIVGTWNHIFYLIKKKIEHISITIMKNFNSFKGDSFIFIFFEMNI